METTDFRALRITRTYEMTVPAGLEQVFSLLCPKREYEWLPYWKCQMIYSVSGGAEQIAGLVLAPHYSALSIAGYREQLEQAVGRRAELRFVYSWHDEPGFIELLADRIRGTDAHVAVLRASGLLRWIVAESRGR